MKKQKKDRLARSSLPKKRDHIKGWPREHYNDDRSEKVQYKTETSAKGVAAMMMSKTGTAPLEAYLCPYCGCWHIGHRKLLPAEQRQLILKETIEGEMYMITKYKKDLDHVAREVLALESKIENLEYLVEDHYRELYLITLNNNRNENNTLETIRAEQVCAQPSDD